MKHSNIKKGEYISTTMYMKVVDKNNSGITVQDSNGQKFDIQGISLIEKTMKSANQFSKTEKVSRTVLAEILTNLGDQVFTINFDKQDGSNRTMIGYKLSTENLMGRVNVHDLEVTTGHPIRQVDLRTTQYLIVNDTKYQVK